MQFAVHENANDGSRKRAPYVRVGQSDLVESAHSCVVVPLITLQRAGQPVSRLMPIIEVADESVVMDTLQLAAIPRPAWCAGGGSDA